MEERLEAYLIDCQENDEPLNIPEMALFLGFTSRSSLYEYAQRPGFTDAVKSACLRVEAQLVRDGMSARNPAAHIFILKNMGYSDHQTRQDTQIRIDLNKLPDHLLARLADGEHPYSVLAGSVREYLDIPEGEAVEIPPATKD